MTTTLFITFLLFYLAGCAEGAMDYLQFHYQGNNTFWNPLLSWVNKWKDGNPLRGERFPLSSSFLVAFTDGWHLMKLFRNVLLFVGIAFAIQLPEIEDTLALIMFIIGMRGAYGIGFVMMYDMTLPGIIKGDYE